MAETVIPDQDCTSTILLIRVELESFTTVVVTVATDELLCLKNSGTQISMFFTSNE